MFIPRVKSEQLSGERKTLSFPIKLYLIDKPSRELFSVLKEFLPFATFSEVGDKNSADMVFSVRPGVSEKKEYYEISSTEDCFVVTAKDKRGLINAAATLAQMISCENGDFTLALGEISDWPDKCYRCLMHDTGRKYIPIDEFKSHILMLAKLKMNKLHWHLVDKEGYSVLFNCCPDIISPDKNGRKYTVAEVKSLIEYASLFGIDIIPEIDIPGHGDALLEARPELKCDVKAGVMNGWAMCISNEKTYAFIMDILTEVAEIFPYDYIHIGTDEIDVRDFHANQPHQFYHDWDDCESCKKKFGSLGLSTTTERFYYFIKRVYSIITSLGKKMMMWNDNIDIAKSPDLPRDILIDFWRVADASRGPREGCSMLRFLEEGFEVINSDCTNGYIDAPNHARWHRVKPWNIDMAPAKHEGEYSHLILGGQACAWEDYAHYKYSFLISVSVFADKFYNLAPITDDMEASYKEALTRFILGVSCPKGENIFDKYLKGVFLITRDIDLLSPNCDKEEFKALLISLSELCAYEKRFVDAYLSYLDM